MASRRKLKKVIGYVASELLSDIYFHCLASGKFDNEKVENLALEINDLKTEFIQRLSHSDGKENAAMVKKYYRKLYADWLTSAEKIAEKIKKL